MTSWRSGLRLGYLGGRVGSFLPAQILGVLWKRENYISVVNLIVFLHMFCEFYYVRLERVVV
jgi:hypothetical protein